MKKSNFNYFVLRLVVLNFFEEGVALMILSDKNIFTQNK